MTEAFYGAGPAASTTRALARREPVKRSARVAGHTPAEARELWCPFSSVGDNRFIDTPHVTRIPHRGCHCLAGKCAAWRWTDDGDRGFCGMVGSP